MTTAEMPTASTIAHRRSRAGRLMLEQDQPPEVAEFAAFYAERLSWWHAGMGFRDLTGIVGSDSTASTDAAYDYLMAMDPATRDLSVRAIGRAVETSWDWICDTDPTLVIVGPRDPQQVWAACEDFVPVMLCPPLP